MLLEKAYISVDNGQVYVNKMHINPYEKGNIFNKDPLRKRKLLLHKREINKLRKACTIKGYTVVPTKMYLKNGIAKMEIALARGKALYDKRQSEKEKDAFREIQKQMKIR